MSDDNGPDRDTARSVAEFVDRTLDDAQRLKERVAHLEEVLNTTLRERDDAREQLHEAMAKADVYIGKYEALRSRLHVIGQVTYDVMREANGSGRATISEEQQKQIDAEIESAARMVARLPKSEHPEP